MSPRNLLMMLVVPCLLACKKEKETNNPVSPPTSAALLKEIAIPRLPSHFYHFEYDADSNVIFASFASDLTRYDITYEAGRIHEMRNNILVNKDRLQYFYDSGGH